MTQHQHHGKRSPRGKPQLTERIAQRVTLAEKRKVARRGGAAWVRKLIREAE